MTAHWFEHLLPSDEAPTPYARPVRVLTRGKRDVQWVWMVGRPPVPELEMEGTEEVDAIMREPKAVEV